LIYLQPVSGAIISYVLFEEKLNSLGLLGTGLIFVALILILSRKQKKIPELKSLEPEFVVVNR
jgi:drug/metabolite transporter (DMT)-like permease